MLPTPDTSKVDFSNVYEPSEDSFLLLDALSQSSEVQFLSKRFAKCTTPLALEVGSGSGVVLAFLAANAKAIVAQSHLLALSTDVNTFACQATASTLKYNLSPLPEANGAKTRHDLGAVFLDAVNTSLANPIKPHAVDILIFNPPYVPSENVPQISSIYEHSKLSSFAKFERDSQLLALATDGGAEGMEITNRLLSQLPEVLHPDRGVAYILLCAQNDPESVKNKIRSWGSGWAVETVRSSGKQGGWEKLQIIRIERSSPA